MATIHVLPDRSAVAPPSNVEAEAALLGAVLIDNELLGLTRDLKPEHFFAPVHGRVFERIVALVERNAKVTPVTLKPYFESDDGLKELGGTAYLARLTADGQGLLAPRELAEQIRELAERRRLAAVLQASLSGVLDQSVPIADIILPERPAHGETFTALDLSTLSRSAAKPAKFAIERFAPVGEVTLLSGPGGAGKSLLGQQLATAAAAGKPCLGLQILPGPALYLTCEDDPETLHWRQSKICSALDVDMAQLAGRLHLVSLRGELSNELGTFLPDGTMRPAAAYYRLDRMIAQTGAELVFLDNATHLFTGNENDRGEVTRFSNLLNRLAMQRRAAVILFGHMAKGGTFSGSTAWVNAVRSQATLAHDPETDVRTLAVAKANYAQTGDAITFMWSDWAFVREADLPDAERSDHDEVVRAAADNGMFLACLRERNRQQRAVSERIGPNYAPKVFAAMPESRKIGKTRLAEAMDRLFRLGKIERAELWKGPDRKWVAGLRETENPEFPKNG